jgi:GT2 family glycosyltransferase
VAHQFSKPTPVQISVVDDFFINSLSIPLVNTSSVAIRTRELKELGGFKETIVSGQDIDLWIRLGLKEPLVFNEMHTSIYDKTVSNSLSKENHQESKYQLFKSYEAAATSNNSLKIYLNSLKYSLAIQCVLSNNGETFKKIKKELDYSSLNWKQKLLLKQPKTLTKILKKIHTLLKAKGLYISSYA